MKKNLLCPLCKLETVRIKKKYKFPLWDADCVNCSFGLSVKAPMQEVINAAWKELFKSDVWSYE